VSQTSRTATTSLPLSRPARLLWAALILATLYLCYFHNLGALGLVGPDEPRYAWIARDMAETGDWVTPRLYGKPWFEKPPLYYWAAALSFKVFGVSEAAARLPSAVCALLATLAMAWLAWLLYGPETARWVLLLLPTTVGMIGFSHAAATDMPFAAMLTIAMVLAAHLLNLIPSPAASQNVSAPPFSFTSFTSSTSFTSFFLGVFLGLATLAKGPAAIILSGGGVLLWAALTKRWRDAFRCLHPVAIAGFCLTALPWYILCARRNPDFFHVFLIEHNFKRFLTPEFQHIQPFWYYLPVLLVALFPWTVFLLCTALFRAAICVRERRLLASHVTIFLSCWPLFCLLFFSNSQSKLPGYILPTIPVLGIYLAHGITSSRAGAVQTRVSSLLFALTFAAAVALGFSKSWFHLPKRILSYQQILVLLLWALGLMFLLLATSFLAKIGPSLAISLRIIAFAIFLLAIFALTDKRFIESYGIYNYSTRDLSRALKKLGASPQNLRLVRPRRSQQYQLNFYFHAELKEWDGEARSGDFLAGESISCASLKQGSSCKDLWGEMDKTDDWELLKISKPSLPSGLDGGGNGGRSAGGNLNDGQPR